MQSQGHRASRRTQGRGSRGIPALALALTAALPLSAVPLRAETEDERPAERRRTLSAAERVDPAGSRDAARLLEWVPENLHIHKGTGLEYRRRLRMGDRPIELGVQGPVVRKRKSLGLTLVVRF